jgi:hypothetical protein
MDGCPHTVTHIEIRENMNDKNQARRLEEIA